MKIAKVKLEETMFVNNNRTKLFVYSINGKRAASFVKMNMTFTQFLATLGIQSERYAQLSRKLGQGGELTAKTNTGKGKLKALVADLCDFAGFGDFMFRKSVQVGELTFKINSNHTITVIRASRQGGNAEIAGFKRVRNVETTGVKVAA